MIVLDTSVVVAYMNRRDDHHERVGAWMDTVDERLFTTPLIVAEIDHLVSRVGGPEAARAFHEDLTSGAYIVQWWPEAMMETVAVAGEHRDIGLSDASLIALASWLETVRIATLDERHFRFVRPVTGEAAFTLLPVDAWFRWCFGTPRPPASAGVFFLL